MIERGRRMRPERWLCLGVLYGVWIQIAFASWDPRPMEADGTVVSACHYSDVTRFAVTGSGVSDSGKKLANGYFEYAFGGSDRELISPGDVLHVQREPSDHSALPMAHQVEFISQVSTGGATRAEITLAEAQEEATQRFVEEEYWSVARVALPAIFLGVMVVGLFLRMLLVRRHDQDAGLLPDSLIPVVVIAMVALAITIAAGKFLYDSVYQMVTVGLA